MDKNSTILDLFNVINNAYSYGYYEGLKYIHTKNYYRHFDVYIPDEYKNLSIYKLETGT